MSEIWGNKEGEMWEYKIEQDNMKKAVGLSKYEANKTDFFDLMKMLPGDIKHNIGKQVTADIMYDWKKIFNNTIKCINLLEDYVYEDELASYYVNAIGMIYSWDGESYHYEVYGSLVDDYKRWCKAAMKFDWKQDEIDEAFTASAIRQVNQEIKKLKTLW